VDVPPPWYALSIDGCASNTRICVGSDAACRDRAQHDGYVAISTYQFCKRDDVRTVPRPAGGVLIFAVVLGGAFVVRLLRRKRVAKSS